MDEGTGGMFKKNGLDKARVTKDLQKKDRDDIDAQIKNSQDRIEKLRTGYAVQVKEYNDRVAAIEGRAKSQRGETEASIKNLEKENADTMISISAYNKECDEKIAALNVKKGELIEQNKKKIVEDQNTIQTLHVQNDIAKEKIVNTYKVLLNAAFPFRAETLRRVFFDSTEVDLATEPLSSSKY
jgi:hypothetical protein